MEMALNERSAAYRSAASSADGVTAASVARMHSIVAMLGWIMPAPLAMPARENLRARHFPASRFGRD